MPKKIPLTKESAKKWMYYPLTDNTLSSIGAVLSTWVATEKLIDNDGKAERQKMIQYLKEKQIYYYDDEMGEYFNELDQAKYEHDHIYKPMQRYSCIAMLFSTLEHELYNLRKNLDAINEKTNPKRDYDYSKEKNEIFKAKKYLLKFENINWEDCPQYSIMHDILLIRNCIIHCLGNVSAMGKKEERDKLLKMGKEIEGFTCYENSDIRIHPLLMIFLIEQVNDCFCWIFGKLNWEISVRHLEKRRLESATEIIINLKD